MDPEDHRHGQRRGRSTGGHCPGKELDSQQQECGDESGAHRIFTVSANIKQKECLSPGPKENRVKLICLPGGPGAADSLSIRMAASHPRLFRQHGERCCILIFRRSRHPECPVGPKTCRDRTEKPLSRPIRRGRDS